MYISRNGGKMKIAKLLKHKVFGRDQYAIVDKEENKIVTTGFTSKNAAYQWATRNDYFVLGAPLV